MKKNRYVLLLLLLSVLCFPLINAGCSGGSGESAPSPTPTPTPTATPAQVWILTNDAGDVAKVIVQPFTYSGTFTETSDSPHWWLYDSGGNPVAQIPLEGTIVHDNPYDRWSFTITASGGGMTLTGQGEGSANGTMFPELEGGTVQATQVNGTVTGTVTSPMGDQPVSGTWSGVMQ
jgi:hypothetical protein